jgi:GTPase SAR1 family protein
VSVSIGNRNAQISLRDTSGMDNYRSFALNQLKLADGIMLVFSLTDKDSLRGAKEWMDYISS